MRQQMDKLGELMRQQQQLMDETMRADRERQSQSGEGRDRQQQDGDRHSGDLRFRLISYPGRRSQVRR